MAEILVGQVTHHFGHLGVAAVALIGELRVGDTIHVAGHTSDFVQPLDSIEIEHQRVQSAGAGQSVGIRMMQHARVHDRVFKVVPA